MSETTGDAIAICNELRHIQCELRMHRKLLRRIKIGVDMWLTMVIIAVMPVVLVGIVLIVRWVLIAIR